ncbi:MAG: hypothetical protein H0W74_08505 [Sphingosinicella sp.]|nr:hypothetical protein [Sphingosinicella sp.]
MFTKRPTFYRMLLPLALLAGGETAALACSCIAPGPPEEARAQAREVTRNIVAIVDAEAITEYRPDGGGEEVIVHRTLFGEAPKNFRIERSPSASSVSCDLLLKPRERKILILTRSSGGRYQIQNLCSDYLTSGAYLPILLDESARSSGQPNPAGERAAICPGREVSAPA